MRAEKGFIMIGDETDGTVIPQDLGLGWAISKKKSDYLGKRAQERPHMTDPDRWKLVGLRTLDGSVLPEGAYAIADGRNANGQRNTQGRVTSTYHSPTLGHGIAMGLVRHGWATEWARLWASRTGRPARSRRGLSARSSTTPRGRSRMSEVPAREALAKLCPVDLAPGVFEAGEMRRTRLAQVPAAFWWEEDGFTLVCFRSVAQYAFDVLKGAADGAARVGHFTDA
jgi:hypothetical protein